MEGAEKSLCWTNFHQRHSYQSLGNVGCKGYGLHCVMLVVVLGLRNLNCWQESSLALGLETIASKEKCRWKLDWSLGKRVMFVLLMLKRQRSSSRNPWMKSNPKNRQPRRRRRSTPSSNPFFQYHTTTPIQTPLSLPLDNFFLSFIPSNSPLPAEVYPQKSRWVPPANPRRIALFLTEMIQLPSLLRSTSRTSNTQKRSCQHTQMNQDQRTQMKLDQLQPIFQW